jgi:hypothetical protein
MHTSHKLTASEYLAHEADQRGVCLSCGAWSEDTDPATARARCGSCGTDALHGVEQALLLGVVHIHR